MKRYVAFLLMFICSFSFYGQDLNAEELYTKARTAAFEKNDYDESITLLKEALDKNPDFTDASVFLGRLYIWKKDWDTARKVFDGLKIRNVQDEDYYIASASLEYWTENQSKAAELIDEGLSLHPNSEQLWLLKAKVLYTNKNYTQAETAVNSLIAINPKNTEARQLASQITEFTSKNAVSMVYQYSHFDKQFDDDWHVVGISYKRVTSLGPVIVRGNYARKFAQNGTQIEVEAYPRLSKMFYLYIGGGYSNDVGLFPKYRTGVSLNANLPRSFEAEIGYRQLYFTDHIWLYTASVAKYYKNFWFSFRTYITPDHQNIAHSYTGTVRYYTKRAQDYFSVQAGTGISPEENRNNLLESNAFKIKTFKIGADYNFSIHRNAFSLGTMYYNQEYRPDTKGSQFDIILGFSRKF